MYGLFCFPPWLGPVLITAGAATGTLGALGWKAGVTGAILGLTPTGWAAVVGVGSIGVGVVTALWNTRGQAEEILKKTCAKDAVDDYIDRLNIDPLYQPPDGDNKNGTGGEGEPDDGC